MRKQWKAELNQFLLLILISGFSGWAIDYPGWTIAIVISIYSLWMLQRLKDLVIWVDANDDSEAPESSGVWGELFDTLNIQKKHSRQAKSELEEILARAQQSIDAIEEAVIVTNQSGVIQWCNKRAQEMVGLRPSTDIKNPLTNLIRDPRFVRFFNRADFDQGVEIPSPNNPQKILQFYVTVFGDRRDRLLIGRDVTRLNNLEQMRKDFVANVSHELRTPLTVIKGYLETFLDSLDPVQQKALYRGLEQMDQQANRMEMLVADLLLLSKLETNDTEKTVATVKIPRLLQQVYNDAQAVNDEKQHKIELKADPNLLLLGIEDELRSAFSNLVINAVKYTPEEGHIKISWWEDEKGAHLAVKDSGIGIDPRHIPRLTERFYRADPSRHSKTGGTGLGLAIVKHVLIHHDAELEIKSELMKGSEFICHFPPRLVIRQNPGDEAQSVA